MIDIHCHILPGIDDGAIDFSEAVEMARFASADGIDTIIATPHIYDQSLRPERIKELSASLQSLLDKESIAIKIIPGAEFHYDTNIKLAGNYVIEGTDALLIEFPHAHLPNTAAQLIDSLLQGNLHPIIVHPERNASIIAQPGLLLDLLRQGVSVQVTADSITGRWGGAIQNCAHYLLSRAAVNFIASDAHSIDHRPPELEKAVKIAARLAGKKAARQMVVDNPLQLFQDT